MSEPCCDGCLGVIVSTVSDGSDGIERCDECDRFRGDYEAAEWLLSEPGADETLAEQNETTKGRIQRMAQRRMRDMKDDHATM